MIVRAEKESATCARVAAVPHLGDNRKLLREVRLMTVAMKAAACSVRSILTSRPLA